MGKRREQMQHAGKQQSKKESFKRTHKEVVRKLQFVTVRAHIGHPLFQRSKWRLGVRDEKESD
jgi:hypothetical protein